MFNNIAHRYDFLNRILSLGIDQGWRKKVVSAVRRQGAVDICDLATGTGDLALALSKIPDTRVTGLDIAKDMLAFAKQKGAKKGKDIQWVLGDGESLPFADASQDAVTIAFGIRNYENLDQGLAEMYRVLRKNGNVYVLEFSKPHRSLFKPIFMLYFRYILPTIGKLISGDASAYTYLPDSVNAFPDGEDFLAHLRKAGFTQATARPLTFGVATLYSGVKV